MLCTVPELAAEINAKQSDSVSFRGDGAILKICGHMHALQLSNGAEGGNEVVATPTLEKIPRSLTCTAEPAVASTLGAVRKHHSSQFANLTKFDRSAESTRFCSKLQRFNPHLLWLESK